MSARAELCLTRGRHPWEGGSLGVTESELQSIMAVDDSLAQDLSGGGRFAIRWSGHPSSESVVLMLDAGNLIAPRNDRPTIRKMVELSNVLGARVFGDDGERYGLDGSWTHPAAVVLANSLAAGTRDRRSFFRSLVGIREDPRSARSVLAGRAPFRKGDRVIDGEGVEGVVLGIEFVDGGSRDVIAVRAADGRLLRFAIGNAGLEKVRPSESGHG